MGLWKIFDQFAGSGVEDLEVDLDARVLEDGAHRSDPLLEHCIELMQVHPILVFGARDELDVLDDVADLFCSRGEQGVLLEGVGMGMSTVHRVRIPAGAFG